MAFLLGSKGAIDNELDQLFKTQKSTPIPIPVPGSSKNVSLLKRKAKDEAYKRSASTSRKKVKSSQEVNPETSEVAQVDRQKKVERDLKPSKKEKSPKGKKTIKKERADAKAPQAPIEQDDSSDDSGLENAYNSKSAPPAVEEDSTDATSSEDDELDTSRLVHESMTKKPKKRTRASTSVVPSDETAEQRDQRTIFVGNLPLDVASKKPLKKALQRHLLAFASSAKIESLRFRSVPFQAPTTKLPEDDNTNGTPPQKPKPASTRQSEPRTHEKERASLWRSKQANLDHDSVKVDEKKYLNPAQKKKIAFINQEFHSTADAVNAYVVFAHPPDTTQRAANLPPLPPTLNPYEAALTIAARADGSAFMGRSLRVDLVGKQKTIITSRSQDGEVSGLLETDPRLSIFVGNLDFATKEEDLRAFFETLVSTERGGLAENENDDERSLKSATWVTRVRVVRDKDTQLGKGFAYVQFADRDCVDRVLATEESKVKFAKRKLRIQRCKTLPGGAKHFDSNPPFKNHPKAKFSSAIVVVPRGDPTLGAKLAGLSKDERKKAKSTDADRLARRLAKKKARMAMTSNAGKGISKERKRVRSK